jgi:hypothetical protein
MFFVTMYLYVPCDVKVCTRKEHIKKCNHREEGSVYVTAATRLYRETKLCSRHGDRVCLRGLGMQCLPVLA